MAKKITLYERLLKIREEEEKLRTELKEHPEELKSAQVELKKIDAEVVNTNKKLADLKVKRKRAAEIVSVMTGGRIRKAGRAPSGRGKSKIAFEYIASKGVGAMVTVKGIADASGMLGGAAGAWTRRAVDAGFLEQEAPRMPYTIVKVPT